MDRENKSGKVAADSQENLLARWSRRKLDTRRDAPDAPANEAAAAMPLEPPAAEPEKELTDADMPSIEALDEHSDFSPFLSPGVSDGLRQTALRKLFSQPGYNITDGLNDYDEDFTQFASLGNMITHEMKRMLRRELAAEKTVADSADMPSGQEATAAAPVDEVTATAETGNAEIVEPITQIDEPGKGNVPSS